MMRLLIGAILALALAGAAAAQSIVVVVPSPVTAEPLAQGVRTRPVSLTRFAADIPAGTPWRQDIQSPYFMVPCAVTANLQRWTEADNKVGNFESFERAFRDELGALGFRGGRDTTNLFEEQAGSELQVGALVTGLKMKTCLYVPLGSQTLSGSAAMDVEWQVYSVTQGRIVARIKTQGGYEQKPSKDLDPAPILRGAFADNVRRLAANSEFRQIMTAVVPPAPVAPAAISFAPATATTPVSAAVKGVVSIYAGEGQGSGVLISADGYILTNHHVTGSSGQVRIRWADGTDTVGDVLRSDPRRDVALIRTTAKAGPLSIRRTPAQLGETVFAIGTPLRKEFSNTLTRGIVSGTRLIEGQPLIQSDVSIDHGNSGGPLVDEQGQVIALAVSRYEEAGVGRNINFFIPIEEALKALSLSALTPQAPPPPKVSSRR